MLEFGVVWSNLATLSWSNKVDTVTGSDEALVLTDDRFSLWPDSATLANCVGFGVLVIWTSLVGSSSTRSDFLQSILLMGVRTLITLELQQINNITRMKAASVPYTRTDNYLFIELNVIYDLE